MNTFEQKIHEYIRENELYCIDINTLQVNVGFKCNQSCNHCHIEASPQRKEMMEWPVMQKSIQVANTSNVNEIDITGGSPELNPNLKRFIKALRKTGKNIKVRTNLTVCSEPGMEIYPAFYRDNEVQLVASLPCYTEENVSAQRGNGVYEKSIRVLRQLNSLGYGHDPRLTLDLVYNPNGAFLPGEQPVLENDYNKELSSKFNITFSRLLTITNMPIGRFRKNLIVTNTYEDYLHLLKTSFNHNTIADLMCRHQVSVGWDGTLYDCDFNLALGIPVNSGAPNYINSFDFSLLSKRKIATSEHCFGCTAGFGSSCGGALITEQ